ncbi:MAG: TerD family protein [Vibrionaceae bacterium]
MVSLVSLSKYQTVSLSNLCASKLTKLQFGLGWEPIKPKSGLIGRLFAGKNVLDLDASVVLFDAQGAHLDTVWLHQLVSRCGAICHGGANTRPTNNDDDNESIFVDLAKLPRDVECLAFIVHSFYGQTFNKVGRAYCRVTEQNGNVLAQFDLEDPGTCRDILMASVRRCDGAWEFTAHGMACNENLLEKMLEQVASVVLDEE